MLFFSKEPWLFSFLCGSVAVPRLSQPPSAFLCFAFVFLLGQTEEVDPTKAQLGETAFTAQAEQPQDAKETEPAAQSSSQISEVEIPSVGKVPVRSDADGYNEEVQLPAQALIAVHH